MVARTVYQIGAARILFLDDSSFRTGSLANKGWSQARLARRKGRALRGINAMRRIARITAHHAAETAAHVADHQKACQQSQSIPNSPPQASPSTPPSTMQDQTSATSRNLGVPPTGSTTPASTSRAPSMDPTGRNNNTTVSLRDTTVAQKASTVPY
ncbi:hypothetical protein PCANC_08796 [Puccinia coronata f. sp. avenae]|uniref:Uncharacterized protein n=1 Tax=Puccinia coronata f. sp. avenae TaxID=200324 RepID=A0A2N5V6T8_9BASI|nr:hypothetical protein PCASD_07056 [Puccinia coronata f. sp. avenae]PLW46194.1 hypothetical protein PCANC_08796 [Puccinia coronata f. sp. avenae]